VNLSPSELTRQAEGLLINNPVHFLSATFFLLMPNLLLSFFLFGYIKAHPDEKRNPLILCVFSLACATLLSASIWIFLYTEFSQIPLLVFGFPMTYFLGMSAGYVIGLLILGVKR